MPTASSLRQQLDELRRRLYWTQVAVARGERLLQMLEGAERAEEEVEPVQLRCKPSPPRLSRMDEAKRQLMEMALEEARGNRQRAAKLMGISRNAFYRLLERFGQK